MAFPTTHTAALQPDLELTLTEAGTGRPVLILHGGGGPFTVAGIAAHLADRVHTIVPTHPGWNGTARPAWLSNVDALAQVYVRYLEAQGLQDVLVIGSSLGGWVAAAMALHAPEGMLTGLILIDAVGVAVAGEPIRDFFALDARGVAEYSYYDADRFYVDPVSVPPAQAAARQANMATMRALVSDPYMHDPELLSNLSRIPLPVLVIWGDSDRIVTPAYGAAFAKGFPHGRLAVVEKAGHLPHFEQLAATFALIDAALAQAG